MRSFGGKSAKILAAVATVHGLAAGCGNSERTLTAGAGGRGDAGSGGVTAGGLSGGAMGGSGSAGKGSGATSGTSGTGSGGSAASAGTPNATGGEAGSAMSSGRGGSASGGGGTAGGGSGGSPAAGTAGQGDAGEVGAGGENAGDYGDGCPESLPEHRSPCTAGKYLNCTYGDDPRPYCKPMAECSGNVWLLELPICDPPETNCPADPLAPPLGMCDTHPHECFYADMTCGCDWRDTDLYAWQCYPNPEGCPPIIVNAGTHCAEDLKECRYSYSCYSRLMRCQNGVWQYVSSSASDECIPPLEEP
jgi:hypothetical protein